jgi:hypothetical protein
MINQKNYFDIVKLLGENIVLVAVSKTKPVESIQELYDLGHRDFGENYVQELEEKHSQLPKDIRWHFIGHLQSNKIKYIAPFVHLIHGIDSFKLLKEVDKQAKKNQPDNRCVIAGPYCAGRNQIWVRWKRIRRIAYCEFKSTTQIRKCERMRTDGNGFFY